MKSQEKEFERIVMENKSTIYTVCYMFSKDQDEVNDLFQDTLVNLWKGFKNFRGESKPSTWIYRVALNTCITADNKKKRRGPTIPLTMDVDLYRDHDAESLQVQILHKRISRLDVVDRAIVLMWLENMSYDEIASIVGITPQNVGVKLFRIREKLKQMK